MLIAWLVAGCSTLADAPPSPQPCVEVYGTQRCLAMTDVAASRSGRTRDDVTAVVIVPDPPPPDGVLDHPQRRLRRSTSESPSPTVRAHDAVRCAAASRAAPACTDDPAARSSARRSRSGGGYMDVPCPDGATARQAAGPRCRRSRPRPSLPLGRCRSPVPDPDRPRRRVRGLARRGVASQRCRVDRVVRIRRRLAARREPEGRRRPDQPPLARARRQAVPELLRPRLASRRRTCRSRARLSRSCGSRRARSSTSATSWSDDGSQAAVAPPRRSPPSRWPAAASACSAASGGPYPDACEDLGFPARQCDVHRRQAHVPVRVIAPIEVSSIDILPPPHDGRHALSAPRDLARSVPPGRPEPSRRRRSGASGVTRRRRMIACDPDPRISIAAGRVGRDVPCAGRSDRAAPPCRLPRGRRSRRSPGPLRVPSLDIPLDHLGPYEVEVGEAGLPDGALSRSSASLVDPSPAILLDRRNARDRRATGRPGAAAHRQRLPRAVRRRRTASTVFLVFDVTELKSDSVLQVRDLVVE